MAESFDNVRISKFQNPFAGDKMMFDDGAAALSFSIKKSLVTWKVLLCVCTRNQALWACF